MASVAAAHANSLTTCTQYTPLARTSISARLSMQVPRMANVTPHAIAGAARINLTFRRLKPECVPGHGCLVTCKQAPIAFCVLSLRNSSCAHSRFEKSVPKCKCGKRAILKAAYPKGVESTLGVRQVSETQRYYFACDNTQSASPLGVQTRVIVLLLALLQYITELTACLCYMVQARAADSMSGLRTILPPADRRCAVLPNAAPSQACKPGAADLTPCLP